MRQDYTNIDYANNCDIDSYSYNNYLENEASHSHL